MVVPAVLDTLKKQTLERIRGWLPALSRSKAREEQPLTVFLNTISLFSSEDLKRLSSELDIPYLDSLPLGLLSKERIKAIPYSFVKKHEIFPFAEEEGRISLALHDPYLTQPLDELEWMLKAKVRPFLCSKEEIIHAIHTTYEKGDRAASELLARLEGDGEKDDEAVVVFDLLDGEREGAPIVKLLNLILMEAIQQGASDIHFEPDEEGLRVRYRIDGVLHNRHTPAVDYQNQLITRIKVMSKLDIAEHRLPQDGRIKLRMGRREVDFRVSTIPVSGGERVVLRILDRGNVQYGLEQMGMDGELLERLRSLLALPEGIILVTGPTGSGKTTTLYSALQERSDESTNIMTIEDPVEYQLPGIAQIAVHHKINLDFATGLRHILRQDPDVIMVGEIRDLETAEIAVQAALTGHLVLSTLHTNDAPSAITRLVDMGIEPYLLSSSVVGILAQRLVRRICPHCKEPFEPTLKELEKIGINSPVSIFQGKGCSHCFGSGYKGRHALYELLVIDYPIQKQIVKSPDGIELKKLALEGGMKTLLDSGRNLVLQGHTTIEEVLRATRGVVT
jgi:general secretion pathway protein E